MQNHTKAAAVLAFVTGLLISCTKLNEAPLPRNADGPAPTGAGGTGTTSGQGGTQAQDAMSGGTNPGRSDGPAVTDPGCAAGFHICNGTCVDSLQVANCGVACEPCHEIIGGAATCDGNKCGVGDRRDC
jgi:hypothetical protein